MLNDAERRELAVALESIYRITRSSKSEIQVAKNMTTEQRKPRERALVQVCQIEMEIRKVLAKE